MKRALAMTAVAAATIGLAACSTGANSSQSSATSEKITVYAALTSTSGTALAAAFHASHPSETVTMVTGGTGALVTRLEAEQKAGALNADAVLLADPTVMPELTSDGILSDYVPSAAAKLPSNLKGNGWFSAFDFNDVIIYHTGTTPVPTDWSDLTKSAYKNEIEIGDPSYSGTSLAMAAELPSLAGANVFSELKTNGVKIVESTTTVGADVASGARSVGVTLDSVYRALAAKGSPVKIVWPSSGAIPVPAPAGAVKGQENNPVVKDFLSWLLTSQGQQELVKLGYAPVLGSSNAVPDGTKMVSVNYSALTSQRSAILESFQKVLG